jgi:hypothetical protein
VLSRLLSQGIHRVDFVALLPFELSLCSTTLIAFLWLFIAAATADRTETSGATIAAITRRRSGCSARTAAPTGTTGLSCGAVPARRSSICAVETSRAITADTTIAAVTTTAGTAVARGAIVVEREQDSARTGLPGRASNSVRPTLAAGTAIAARLTGVDPVGTGRAVATSGIRTAATAATAGACCSSRTGAAIVRATIAAGAKRI